MAVPAGPPSGPRVWRPLARDTPVEVEERQIEAWRRITLGRDLAQRAYPHLEFVSTRLRSAWRPSWRTR